MMVSFINPALEKLVFSFEKLPLTRIVRLLDLLEKRGNYLGMPYSKPIGKGLFELRARGKHEIRLFYCFYVNRAVIVHAFIKKTRQTPKKELEHAYHMIKLLPKR